jgi:hypothetical protein
MNYTEDILVQQTTANYLVQQDRLIVGIRQELCENWVKMAL